MKLKKSTKTREELDKMWEEEDRRLDELDKEWENATEEERKNWGKEGAWLDEHRPIFFHIQPKKKNK